MDYLRNNIGRLALSFSIFLVFVLCTNSLIAKAQVANSIVGGGGGNLSTAIGTLGIKHGGTATTTGGVTGGVDYFDGTKITNNANLTTTGTGGLSIGPSGSSVWGWGADAGNGNQLDIEPGAFTSPTAANPSYFNINQTGRVGVGTTTPWGKFSVNGTAGGTIPVFVVSTSTSAFATSTALNVDQNGNLTLFNGTTVSTPNLNVTNVTYTKRLSVPGLTTSTSGTLTANTFYMGEIVVPVGSSIVLTGVQFFNGSTVTGNVIVALFNSSGTEVASSASTAQAGSFGVQSVPFSSQFTAAPGQYFLGFVPSSASADFGLTASYGLSKSVGQITFTTPTSTTTPAATGAYIPDMSTY